MNTRTTKFLAALAVLVMAFAVVAIVSPASDDDAALATGTTTIADANRNVASVAATGNYYFDTDMTVNVSVAITSANTTFYVLTGVSIDIYSSYDTDDNSVSLYSVQKAVYDKSAATTTITFHSAGADNIIILEKTETITATSSFSSSKASSCFTFSDGTTFNVMETTTLAGTFDGNVYMVYRHASTSQSGADNPVITAKNLTAKIYGGSNIDTKTSAVLTVQSFSGTLRVSNAGLLEIETITSGAVTIDAVAAEGTATYFLGSTDTDITCSISSGARLNIADSAVTPTVTLIGNMYNAGTIQTMLIPAVATDNYVIYNDGNIVVKLDSDGAAPTMTGRAAIQSSEAGVVDISAFAEQATFTGIMKGDLTVSETQVMTFTDDVTIAEGKTLYVCGQLVINPNVTLTVESGGRMIVGTDSDGASQWSLASVTNNGIIDVKEHTTSLSSIASATNTYTEVDAITVVSGNIVNNGTFVTPGNYDYTPSAADYDAKTVTALAETTNAAGNYYYNTGSALELTALTAANAPNVSIYIGATLATNKITYNVGGESNFPAGIKVYFATFSGSTVATPTQGLCYITNGNETEIGQDGGSIVITAASGANTATSDFNVYNSSDVSFAGGTAKALNVVKYTTGVGGSIANAGSFTLGDSDRAVLQMVNAKSGTAYLSGDIVGASKLIDFGSIIVDGVYQTAALDIYTNGSSANVSVVSVTLNTADSDMLNIYSSKNTLQALVGTPASQQGAISLRVSIVDTEVFGFTAGYWSAKISDYGVSDTAAATTYGLAIAGAPSVSDTSTPAYAKYTFAGNVVVTGTMSFDKYSKLELGSSKLRVYGQLDSAANTITDTASKVYVYGKITSTGQFTATGMTMNAAYYSSSTTYTYGPLGAIKDAAVADNVNTIYVAGTVDIEDDLTIPTGMTVNMKAASLYIGVDSEPTMTMTSGSRLTGSNTIYVNGALYAENYKNVSIADANIIAEVTSFNKVTSEKLWTNVANALKTASPGSIIALTGNWTVTKDMTIPEGITIDSVKNAVTVTVDDATLTIEGVLIAGAVALADSDNDGETGEVDIAGEMVNTSEYANPALYGDAIYYQADAAYAGEASPVTYYVLTGVKNLPIVALAGYDAKVYASSIGTAIVIGDGTNTITFVQAIDDADLTIDSVTLFIEKNKDVSMNISNSVGQYIFADANSASKGMTFVEKDDVLTLSGTTIAQDSDDYAITVEGAVAAEAYTLTDAITINGALVAEGTVKLTGDVYIVGSLVADNAAKVTIGSNTAGAGGDEDTEAIVLGTLSALEATDDEAAGRVTIVPTALILGDAEEDVGSSAVVSGKVSATQYWVYAGSNIDAALILDLKYSSFEIAGDEWLTVYGTGNIAFGADGLTIKPVMPSAAFSGWYLSDDEDETLVTGNKAINYQTYVADVDFNVYTVKIKTDAGIKAISLDGMVMINGTAEGTNVFVLDKLMAGEYKVTYTLMSGYEGTPVLYTEAGTIMKGYTIEVIGDYTDEDGIVYQLLGTEKEVTPEPEPTPTPEEKSEWTVTTILLCVLVVLIAIMAVIVALRLNRN